VSRPDAGASAALSEQFIKPVIFVYMDILTDPVRANNSGQTVVVTGSSIPDLNGTYDGITADFGEVSPVKVSDGGSNTVTCKLSGIVELDADTMNLLNDQSKWKGRIVRIWRLVRDGLNVDRGQFQHFYTGYMVDVTFGGTSEMSWIEVAVENYLVAFSRPSNRSYMEQTIYDPGDLSPLGTIASINGKTKKSDGAAGYIPGYSYQDYVSESGGGGGGGHFIESGPIRNV